MLFIPNQTVSRFLFKSYQLSNLLTTSHYSVIATKTGSTGQLILNRPKFLNALDLDMVSSLTSKLVEYERDGAVRTILVKGKDSKVFCVGGDMKSILGEDPLALSDRAFRVLSTEYSMVHLISLLRTPSVSLMRGIAMGAGVGIAYPCRYRIATESTVCAVPETAIGFFPDVGATFYLPRMPGALGMYLGLTGNRISGRDVVTSGLATHFIPSDGIPSFESELAEVSSSEEVESVVEKYSRDEDAAPPIEHWDKMCYAFSALSTEEVLLRLGEMGDGWSSRTRNRLLTLSPTALKVTHRALTLGADLSLKDCLRMECDLVLNFLEHEDVFEGVRSVLVEKRETGSKWIPPSLEEVTPDLVDSYFLGSKGQEIRFITPLNLIDSKNSYT